MLKTVTLCAAGDLGVKSNYDTQKACEPVIDFLKGLEVDNTFRLPDSIELEQCNKEEKTMGKRLEKKSKSKKKRKLRDKATAKESRLSSFPTPSPIHDIPVYDFFKDHRAGTPNWDSGMFIDSLIHSIEDGYFLTWEAVIQEEQGLPLSKAQQKMLDGLFSFFDGDDGEPILYIDGLARPSEPWYDLLKKVVPELILDPFETYEIHNEIYHEYWPRIVECLEEHGHDLSLPEGVNDPMGVIPPEIQHRLWLQYCFDELSGLGQEKEITLANEEQKTWRIEGFIERLRECKNSVEYLDLTLEELFKRVKLLQQDEEILIEYLKEELNIRTKFQKLHEVL